MNKMQAFTKTKYGGPEILQLEDIELPPIKNGYLSIHSEKYLQ
jgi:hypothetical protein